MPARPRERLTAAEPALFWEWVRVVRRVRLGFYDSPKKDPKKWVSSKVVQHLALTVVTYGDYPDGTSIRPSVGRLARVCDIDERTVRACLKRLAELGLLDLVVPHRHPGRGGGEGRPAEYRLALPEGLLERVAHLDPDERELVVPEGADMPPERRPRPKKAGAAPGKPRGTAGAARTESGAEPVDNPETPGAARTGSARPDPPAEETPGAAPQTAGAARTNAGCRTRPPTHVPHQSPSHFPTHSGHGADVEGSPAARTEPSARRTHLRAVPLPGHCWGCGAVLDPDGSCFVCPPDTAAGPPQYPPHAHTGP